MIVSVSALNEEYSERKTVKSVPFKLMLNRNDSLSFILHVGIGSVFCIQIPEFPKRKPNQAGSEGIDWNYRNS